MLELKVGFVANWELSCFLPGAGIEEAEGESKVFGQMLIDEAGLFLL